MIFNKQITKRNHTKLNLHTPRKFIQDWKEEWKEFSCKKKYTNTSIFIKINIGWHETTQRGSASENFHYKSDQLQH